jgi:hypothetical protein
MSMAEPIPLPTNLVARFTTVRPVGYQIRVELDVDTGTGTEDRFAEVAMQWLDEGSRTLADDVRAELDLDPQPPWQIPDDPSAAYGPPGSAWGQLQVARETMTAGRALRHAKRPASAKGWHWFGQQLRQPPFGALVYLHRLGDEGQPVSGCHLNIQAYSQAPGWIRLYRDLDSDALTSQVHGLERQRLWVDLLRSHADRLNPSYGQIGPIFNNSDTNLETCLPVDYGRNRPWNTIVESRRFLRGYTWVTILAEEHAAILGGADAVAATGVFHEVTSLGAGGVWLQATEDYRDYDLAKAEQLFRVLAPVLRPGKPEPQLDFTTGLPRYAEPLLVVYEDAADVDTSP